VVPARDDLPRDIGQQLPGRSGVRSEKLVEQEEFHGKPAALVPAAPSAATPDKRFFHAEFVERRTLVDVSKDPAPRVLDTSKTAPSARSVKASKYRRSSVLISGPLS
jgi:hypothetical protein